MLPSLWSSSIKLGTLFCSHRKFGAGKTTAFLLSSQVTCSITLCLSLPRSNLNLWKIFQDILTKRKNIFKSKTLYLSLTSKLAALTALLHLQGKGMYKETRFLRFSPFSHDAQLFDIMIGCLLITFDNHSQVTLKKKLPNSLLKIMILYYVTLIAILCGMKCVSQGWRCLLRTLVKPVLWWMIVITLMK